MNLVRFLRGRVFGTALLCIVSLGHAPLAKADDQGRDLVIQALAHAGDVEIATGEFRYRLSITTTPPTKEQIARRVAEAQKAIRARSEQLAGNEKAQRIYQDSLKNLEEEIARQMIANASHKADYYFLLGGAKFGGDRYVEFSRLDPNNKPAARPSVVLERSLDGARSLCLFLEGKVGDAVATRRSMFPGTQEPQCLGRLSGYLIELFGPNRLAKARAFDEVVASIEGSPADPKASDTVREVICSCRGRTSTIKLRIDPARGYITPLVQELDAVGNLLREWVSSDYFQDEATQLWFPKVCSYRETAAMPSQGPRMERYEFTPDGVKLNVDVPAERFALKLQGGGIVLDATGERGNQPSYVAERELPLSLDDLEQLSSLPGLKPVKVGDSVPPRSP